MKIELFVEKAIKQDKRNVFSSYKGILMNTPSEFHEFYKEYNPVDVEIKTKKMGNIWFCPAERLDEIKSQYSFYPNSVFIFATCNADPIFMEYGKIYTSYESHYLPELLADSLNTFLDLCFYK